MTEEAPGLGVDASGGPVIDPTQNVLNLVAAGNRRQDDLRQMESAHISEVLAIRETHAAEARRAEADRINAIRQVDVQAVQQAAEVAATQATTLAQQVAISAETLRSQVAAAASAATVALAAALEPVQKDIADLRRAQYEAQGKTASVVETGGANRAYIGLAIAAAAVLSSTLLASAGIIITLLLR